MAQLITARKFKKCEHIPYGKGLSIQFEGPNIRQGSGIIDSATASYFFEEAIPCVL